MTGIIIKPAFIIKVVVFEMNSGGNVSRIASILLWNCWILTGHSGGSFVANECGTPCVFCNQCDGVCFQFLNKSRQRNVIVLPKND